MAEKKISELVALTSVSGGAILPIVAGDTTYKVNVDILGAYNEGLIEAVLTGSNKAFIGTKTFNGVINATNNLTVAGILSAPEITALNVYTASINSNLLSKGLISSSTQIASDISGSFTNLSSSVSVRLSSVEAASGTVDGLVSSSAQIAELPYIHITTGSLNTFTGSIQSEIGNIEAYTASLKGATIVSSSTQISNYYKFAETASANTFYGTQRLSGSLAVSNGIYLNSSSFYLNGSEVFLKETVGGNYFTIKTTGEYGIRLTSNVNKSWLIDTDGIFKPEISAGEIESYTGTKVFNSLAKIHTYTGSIGREEISGIEAYTASLKGAIEISGQDVNVLGMLTAQQFNVTYVSSSTMYQSGSTKFGDTSDDRHEFTGSILVGGEVLGNSGLNQFTSSQNLVNLGISIVSGSLNAQTASQDLVNLGMSTFTGSIRNEVNGIEAYTASLKGQAIVSSSTQISNYYKFAETASANTFYGTQTISGSLNVTSSVNLSGSVVINQLTYPTFGFPDGQHGVEVPTLGVNNVFTMEIPKTVYEYVKNNSGVTLPKGTPVHANDVVGFNSMVIAASASNAATMPATYILAQDLDDQEEGLGIAVGHIQGVNTTGLQAGKAVYVGANGGWTQTKPTGSNLIQNLGIVTKVGVNGGGVVLGAGRSNDVPNIQQGYFWAGNSGSVATPFPTSSFELSGRGVVSSSQQIQNYNTFAVTASVNTFYGNQTITGSLLVSGSVIPRLNFSQAILTGSQTIGATSYDLIHFQNEFDPNGWWNPDAHSFNPTIAGYYNVVLNVWYNTNSYGNIRIRKNTNVVAEFQSTDNGVDQDFTIGGSKIIYLDGNLDYLDFDVYNQSASPADIEGNADGTKTWFTITLLGN